MAERALKDIKNDLETQKGLPHWWLAFGTRAARRALVITTTLAVLQQFIGINAIIYYAPRIFQKAGFADAKAALWATLVVGVVNVVATFITMGMVDKSGRRTLLIWGLTGMVASLGILSRCQRRGRLRRLLRQLLRSFLRFRVIKLLERQA